MNCAFYATSMKFGTYVEHIIFLNINFEYRAISDFTLEGVVGYFLRWPT